MQRFFAAEESMMPRKNSLLKRTISEKKQDQQEHGQLSGFAGFACAVAQWAGRPGAFGLAVASVILWGVTGPIFGFSDTWQLVINTTTTIITFLMVFLIQNTQNRDTLALQVKLAELIIAAQGAKNKMATAEDLSDEDLQALHEQYRSRADELQSLADRKKKAKHQEPDDAEQNEKEKVE